MASEQIGELLGRIRAGLRRRLKRGALLDDPGMRELHDRLLALDPRAVSRTPFGQTRFVVMDTETTGLKAYAGDEILSISLIELEGLKATGREFNSLVNPTRRIPPAATAIHRITDEDVAGAPVLEEMLQDIVDFLGECVLVGHHVNFDIRFLNKTLRKELLCHLKHPRLDTMLMYLAASGRVGHYTLEEVAGFSQVDIQARHTAHGDAMSTARVFRHLAPRLTKCDEPVSKLIRRQYELGHF